MQIDNRESPRTPPTPLSPGQEAHSPEGVASLSSGSASDNALGKYQQQKIRFIFVRHIAQFLFCLVMLH